jgi:hypothetical protein
MSDTAEWIVTVASGQDAKLVATALSAAGAKVIATLDAIGSIIVHADAAVAARLRGVRGVADVSPSGDVNVGPPDDEQTW